MSPEKIRKVLAHHTNMTKGRGGALVSMLVMHVMQGSLFGTAAEFQRERSKKSYHYGIGVDGAILCFVLEADVAWGAGNWPVNRQSINIGLEGYVESLDVSDAQFESLVELVLDITGRHPIPLDRSHVVGHNEVPDPRNPMLRGGISHHTDPGPRFPWDRLMARLLGGEVA